MSKCQRSVAFFFVCVILATFMHKLPFYIQETGKCVNDYEMRAHKKHESTRNTNEIITLVIMFGCWASIVCMCCCVKLGP